MQKIEIMVALLHLFNIDFGKVTTQELKLWLHSLRSISREVEKEIIYRDRSQSVDATMPSYLSNAN